MLFHRFFFFKRFLELSEIEIEITKHFTPSLKRIWKNKNKNKTFNRISLFLCILWRF